VSVRAAVVLLIVSAALWALFFWFAFFWLASPSHAGEIADCIHDRALEWVESGQTSGSPDDFFAVAAAACLDDVADDDNAAAEVHEGLRRAIAEKLEEYLRKFTREQ